MIGEDYLMLRLVRLKGTEKWRPESAGLCFLFFRGGAGKLVINSVNHRLGQGDVLILNGEGGGEIGTDGTGELAFSRFSLRMEHLYPLFNITEISLLHNLIDSYASMRFLAASGPLAVECQRLIGNVPPHFNLEHRSHLLRVVAAVLSVDFKSLQSGRPGFVTMEEHLIQVFEKLSSKDLLSLSAGELAAKFGCSRRHLNRLFHQYFGFSVAALRMELRMLRAVSLLQDTRAKVINVAETCGFNHLGLFNTCFKRRFGTSPGQWRTLSLKTPDTTAGHSTDVVVCPLHSNGLCPMLSGPKLSRSSGTGTSQLKSAALSAVLSRPAGSKGASFQAALVPVPMSTSTELAGHSALNGFRLA